MVLARVSRSLRDATVLSVYLDLTARDPAQRHAWRTQLDDSLRRLRDRIPPSARQHEERAALARAVGHLEARLGATSAGNGARAWVAFATEDEVRYAEALPVHTPMTVEWGRGPRVSPYLRILRQRRTVILAEVNAEGARLYRYFGGTLESLEHLRSHVTLEPHYHMGSMPRQGFHTGTRGSTGTDAVQRQLRAGTQRMLRELAHRLAVLAGDDGWIVIGGTPLPAKAARAALPEGLAGRTLVMSEMHIWASEARIRDCAENGAYALQNERDLADVSATVGGQVSEARRRVIGPEAALRALEAGAVETLYLTERFLDQSPEDAEGAVRSALAHGAQPEVVRGDGADLLDQSAHGVAARLRYVSEIA